MKRAIDNLEHKSQPLAHRRVFVQRIFSALSLALGILALLLFFGTAGYHFLGDLGWIDAIYNASMILSGMGPVDHLTSPESKLFASFYAILSGIVFIALIGLLLSPVVHRIMHRLHLEK